MNHAVGQQIERWLSALTLARTLPFLAAVIALIAWNRGVALLYGLVALLLATLAVAWLAPRINISGVSAHRRHPASLHEGELLTLDIELSIQGRLARYMLELEDRLPCADNSAPTAYFDRVRGQAQLRLQVPCNLRGEYTLGPLTLASAYPLGIQRRQRRMIDSESRLLVYPTPFALRHLPLPASSANPNVGNDNANRAGTSDLFLGVREYRHGDNPRHVHWSATARHGQPMVKEFEMPRGTRLMIILDLNSHAQAGEGRHSTLEYAVKIAISVANFALSEHHMVGLFGLGAQTVLVPPERGAHHYRRLLDTLARVQADGHGNYAEAIAQGQIHLGQGGNLLLFEHGLPAVVGASKTHHPVHALRIRFDMASFGAPTAAFARKRTAHTYVVRMGDDLSRTFQR